MARAVQLSTLRESARQLANVQNVPAVTDAELNALANRHLTEVYDDLVSAGPADYFAANTTVTTVAGQVSYGLDSDFLGLSDVFVVEADGRYRSLPPMGNGQRGRYIEPTKDNVVVAIEYIPVAPVLTLDGDAFDGVSGWEELIVNLMARDILVKREGDPSAVMSTIAALRARITSRSRSRDRGHPKRVTDTDEVYVEPPWIGAYPASDRLACYRLRAGNIELYERAVRYP